jgi:hypothetical protein
MPFTRWEESISSLHRTPAAVPPADLRLVILFMLLWLGGFGFAGISAYYAEQTKQLAHPDNDDAV